MKTLYSRIRIVIWVKNAKKNMDVPDYKNKRTMGH